MQAFAATVVTNAAAVAHAVAAAVIRPQKRACIVLQIDPFVFKRRPTGLNPPPEWFPPIVKIWIGKWTATAPFNYTVRSIDTRSDATFFGVITTVINSLPQNLYSYNTERWTVPCLIANIRMRAGRTRNDTTRKNTLIDKLKAKTWRCTMFIVVEEIFYRRDKKFYSLKHVFEELASPEEKEACKLIGGDEERKCWQIFCLSSKPHVPA